MLMALPARINQKEGSPSAHLRLIARAGGAVDGDTAADDAPSGCRPTSSGRFLTISRTIGIRNRKIVAPNTSIAVLQPAWRMRYCARTGATAPPTPIPT